MEKLLTKEQTKNKALRLLEFRSHSEKELRDKLKIAGAPDEHIEETVEFLINYSLLDDRKYACAKARELQVLKKFGRLRIVSELKIKGIMPEYIEEALGGLELDEEDMLISLVEKKLKGDFKKKSIDRTIRYFATKGYSFDEIKRCIEELKNER